ncbi:hypothetical protein, partial [Mesorhizobium sp.]|uniref:hypothetical protein n=1 Tax=Mesorhizobium sp. TaxID=1871066 RepID=UPI0025C3A8A5
TRTPSWASARSGPKTAWARITWEMQWACENPIVDFTDLKVRSIVPAGPWLRTALALAHK